MRRLDRFLVADHEKGSRGARLLCTFCDSIPVYTLRSETRSDTPIVRYALCAAHGAPYFEPTDTFLVPSDSEPGKEHEIHYPDDGPWSCDCEAFKYSRSLPIGVLDHGGTVEDLQASLGWCRHLERKRRELAGLPDISGKVCEGCGLTWRDRACVCEPLGKLVVPDA